MREGEKLGGSATASTGGKVKRSPGKEPADGGLRGSPEPGRKMRDGCGKRAWGRRSAPQVVYGQAGGE